MYVHGTGQSFSGAFQEALGAHVGRDVIRSARDAYIAQHLNGTSFITTKKVLACFGILAVGGYYLYNRYYGTKAEAEENVLADGGKAKSLHALAPQIKIK